MNYSSTEVIDFSIKVIESAHLERPIATTFSFFDLNRTKFTELTFFNWPIVEEYMRTVYAKFLPQKKFYQSELEAELSTIGDVVALIESLNVSVGTEILNCLINLEQVI